MKEKSIATTAVIQKYENEIPVYLDTTSCKTKGMI